MRILIITGGRIDESFALSLLQKEKFDHMIVVDGALAFWDKVERNPEIHKIRLLEGSYTLKKKDQFGDFVSLIPITRALKGVTLRGFKYPLERHTTYFGESLCVSNELEAEEGFINIEEGMAFLIESRD